MRVACNKSGYTKFTVDDGPSSVPSFGASSINENKYSLFVEMSFNCLFLIATVAAYE